MPESVRKTLCKCGTQQSEPSRIRAARLGSDDALQVLGGYPPPGVTEIQGRRRRSQSWIGDRVGVKHPRRTRVSESELRRLCDSACAQSRSADLWVEFDIRNRSISIVETDRGHAARNGKLHSLYFSSAIRQQRARTVKWFNFPCRPVFPGTGLAPFGEGMRLRYCDKNTPDPDPGPFECPEDPEDPEDPDGSVSTCRRLSCVKDGQYGPDGRCRLGLCDGYKPSDYPYSAIGKVNLFATGTLIGASTVLCAAHSVGLVGGLGAGGAFAWLQNFFKVGKWSIDFAARADASINSPKFPFGIANVYALWVPLGFFFTGATAPGSPNVQSWMQWDVCIAVLDQPIGTTAGFVPAGHTYDVLGLSSQFYGIGYPNCDGPSTPFGDGAVDAPQRPPCCPPVYDLGSLKYLPSVVPGVGRNKAYYDNSIMWGASGRPIKTYFQTSPGEKYYGLIKTDIPVSFGQSGQALLVRDHPRGNGVPVATAVFDYIMNPGSDNDPEPAGANYVYTYCASITPSMAEDIAEFLAIFDPATFLV